MAQYIRGGLYGSIFGDAFGAPFELKRRVTLQKVLKFIDSRFSKSKYIRVGLGLSRWLRTQGLLSISVRRSKLHAKRSVP